MMDSIYFLFLDEIYSPNLNEFKKITKDDIVTAKNHRHFGLAGAIVAGCDIYDLYHKARAIKSKFYPRKADLIFHYTDTLNKRDNFSDLALNKEKYDRYTSNLGSFITTSEFKYTCSFVDKNKFLEKYGVFGNDHLASKIARVGSNMFPKSPFIDYNLYLLCLRNIIVEFYTFITNRKNPSRGIIVAEARGEQEDTQLREAFEMIYYHGVSSISPTVIRRVLLDLFIVPKKQNYIGTQLSDMVIYPTYDALVPKHNPRDDHFINFEKHLEKKLLKNGIKMIP